MSRLTVDDVYEHATGVCFKKGPPGRVGAETEWFIRDRRDPAAHVPLPRVRALMKDAGPPPAGSKITYEPGGQLELSSLPYPDVATAHLALGRDIEHVADALAAHDLVLDGVGVDALRAPYFQLDDGRYHCMREYFGDPGLAMMCTTASVQVCVDIGADQADATRRWRLAHAMGPVLVAAFANSPAQAGRSTGRRSTRQRIWNTLDRARTRPVRTANDPAEDWARYALDAGVMFIRDGWVADPGLTLREWIATGRPTDSDLVDHLSTLFPPVRPQGWLELRMIDALPVSYWPVPIAVVAALFDDPIATDLATEAVQPVRQRWYEAARDALTDPPLARAAARCFEVATAALVRQGATDLATLVDDYNERYVSRGRCPADDRLSEEEPACLQRTR
jgi:glutamate--cysteine ligase